MKINETIKKCVAFLQLKKANDTFEYAGTCFFVFFEINQTKYTCVVTAKHVIEEYKNLVLMKYFKVNLKNGATDTISTKIDSWIKHKNKNVDIAIHGFGFKDNYDTLIQKSGEIDAIRSSTIKKKLM